MRPVNGFGDGRAGVADQAGDVLDRYAVIGQQRHETYLYLILKKAWSVAVSASEARGTREDKERSKEKRPWSWSCRTWLKE